MCAGSKLLARDNYNNNKATLEHMQQIYSEFFFFLLGNGKLQADNWRQMQPKKGKKKHYINK